MTSRRLIVMRHAKAEPFAATDHARALTARGRAAATEAGTYLAATSMVPDYALVSSAIRAVATWEAVAAGSGSAAHPTIDAAILAGIVQVALETLRLIPVGAERVLLVGHNPTATYLAHLLDDGEGAPAAIRGLLQGFPPAALAVLEVSVPWADLGPESARVIDFHVGRG